LFALLQFSLITPFLIFNILDVLLAPFQKSISGLNISFHHSGIHCKNFTAAIYDCFQHCIKCCLFLFNDICEPQTVYLIFLLLSVFAPFHLKLLSV
jgi:hypothetical protein